MKRTFFFTLLAFIATTQMAQAQSDANWTNNDLEEPAHLAQQLKTDSTRPLIISVGPGAIIPHSTDIGATKDAANVARLDSLLGSLKKEASIVIYCGCCPFEHCPNVRPAIALLKKKGYTNYKLLNIPHNIKTDWIDKGYPSVKL